eukprot:5184291-Prymnesium_polylepis.2
MRRRPVRCASRSVLSERTRAAERCEASSVTGTTCNSSVDDLSAEVCSRTLAIAAGRRGTARGSSITAWTRGGGRRRALICRGPLPLNLT